MEDLRATYQIDDTPLPGAHRVFSGTRSSDGLPVVVKGLQAEYPSAEDLASLRHEFSVLSRLTEAPVARALGLFRRGSGVCEGSN